MRLRKLIILIFFIIILSGCAQNAFRRVCINQVCIKAELALTHSEQERGLMYRRSLAKNCGMLFIFREDNFYSFWMKNVRFPLDMIWINQDKVVVDITNSAPICSDSCESIMPREKVRYVLEISSGFTLSHRIHIGDKVSF